MLEPTQDKITKEEAKIDDFPPDKQQAELQEVRRNLARSDDPGTIQRIHNMDL